MSNGTKILLVGTGLPSLIVLALGGTWTPQVIAIPGVVALLCQLAIYFDVDTIGLVLFALWVVSLGAGIYIGI